MATNVNKKWFFSPGPNPNPFFQVSTLHLCCISLDRYFAIVKPFDYHHYMNTRWPVLLHFIWTLLGPAQDERLLVLGQVCSCHDLCGLDVPHSHFICTNTSWMVSQIIRIKLNVYVVGIMLKIVQKWCLASLWNNPQRQLTVLVTKWVAGVSFVLSVMHAW